MIISAMKSRKNGNKQVRCSVCSQCIHSDHLKRHARTHKDILTMNDDEVREELRARHAAQIYREERRQELEEIAQQEGVPIIHCTDVTPSSTLNVISLREELLQNNQEYLEKSELGKQIAAIIDEGVVREESLTRAHKEALDFYRTQRPRRVDIQMVQLRSWQQILMKMISKP